MYFKKTVMKIMKKRCTIYFFLNCKFTIFATLNVREIKLSVANNLQNQNLISASLSEEDLLVRLSEIPNLYMWVSSKKKKMYYIVGDCNAICGPDRELFSPCLIKKIKNKLKKTCQKHNILLWFFFFNFHNKRPAKSYK